MDGADHIAPAVLPEPLLEHIPGAIQPGADRTPSIRGPMSARPFKWTWIFSAAVEQRDPPNLRGQVFIVGGTSFWHPRCSTLDDKIAPVIACIL